MAQGEHRECSASPAPLELSKSPIAQSAATQNCLALGSTAFSGAKIQLVSCWDVQEEPESPGV